MGNWKMNMFYELVNEIRGGSIYMWMFLKWVLVLYVYWFDKCRFCYNIWWGWEKESYKK